ncbi:MAG: hypothetical protein K2Z81_22740 [Cyanobacteria bacterium]|nr:hypothetical protein [Cyanobacteriota bacterium]
MRERAAGEIRRLLRVRGGRILGRGESRDEVREEEGSGRGHGSRVERGKKKKKKKKSLVKDIS